VLYDPYHLRESLIYLGVCPQKLCVLNFMISVDEDLTVKESISIANLKIKEVSERGLDDVNLLNHDFSPQILYEGFLHFFQNL
jgi:hypothetical protein